MDFIEFLKDKKLNGEDVYFKNNQFICNGKVYFSVNKFSVKKCKKQFKVVDSAGKDTKYKIIMLKNSSEWHIIQKRDGNVGQNSLQMLFRSKKLSGYRYKLNGDKVEAYFAELTKDEKKWISLNDLISKWLCVFLFVSIGCLLMLLFVFIAY